MSPGRGMPSGSGTSARSGMRATSARNSSGVTADPASTVDKRPCVRRVLRVAAPLIRGPAAHGTRGAYSRGRLRRWPGRSRRLELHERPASTEGWLPLPRRCEGAERRWPRGPLPAARGAPRLARHGCRREGGARGRDPAPHGGARLPRRRRGGAARLRPRDLRAARGAAPPRRRRGRGLLPLRRGAVEEPPHLRLAIVVPHVGLRRRAQGLAPLPPRRAPPRRAARAPARPFQPLGARRRGAHRHAVLPPHRAQEPLRRAARLPAAGGPGAPDAARGPQARLGGPRPRAARGRRGAARGQGARARGGAAAQALPALEGEALRDWAGGRA